MPSLLTTWENAKRRGRGRVSNLKSLKYTIVYFKEFLSGRKYYRRLFIDEKVNRLTLHIHDLLFNVGPLPEIQSVLMSSFHYAV